LTDAVEKVPKSRAAWRNVCSAVSLSGSGASGSDKILRRSSWPPLRSEMPFREHCTCNVLRVTPYLVAISSLVMPRSISVGMFSHGFTMERAKGADYSPFAKRANT
jgi:hypothetical protein